MRKKEEIFIFFYLFGWKQEFNRVRGIPRTCHFWQSHDAKACAPGERNNSVVIPREAAARRGRFLPQITALQLTLDQIRRSSSFSMKQEKRSCFSGLKMIGGVSPPVLLRSWVSLLRLRSQSSPAGSMGVFTKRGGGREREKEGERGGVTPPPSAGNEVRQTMCEDEEDSSSQGTSFPRKRANSWFKLVDIYFFALFL